MPTDLPPPPSAPPPPNTAPVEGPDQGKNTDNPIAVAALVCALLALILSIVIIGGFVAIISIVLAIIGLRRSTELGRGKGIAIGAIALSVLAILASVVATVILFAWINTGEDFEIDGIASRSTNTEFPPQADLDEVECTTSEGGDTALAIVTITNRSGGQSNYQITVAWEDDTGDEIVGTLRSEFLPADDSQTMRLFAPQADADPTSCRVTRIERSFFGLFN